MKKLLRLLSRLFLFVFVIITGFVILNFLRFSSQQVEVDLINPIPLDSGVSQRLSEAIRIPTISYEDHIDTFAFEQFITYIDSNFQDVKAELESYKVNQYSMVFHWAGKNPKLKPILLMAHHDVVPIEAATRSQWQEKPFGGIIKDDFIWGRGALDDKHNVLGILEAVQILIKAGYRPDRSLYLAFGHDEEVGGTYGAQSIARRFAEQKISFEYILDEGMVIMEDALPGIKEPVTLLGIAEKGYTTLNLSIELEKGGHSSMPPSETAIGLLSKALYQLEQHPLPANMEGITGQLFDHIGPEMDLMYKVIFANRWLFGGILKQQLSNAPGTNATIRTTTAPTIIKAGVKDNILPAKAEAQINFRILPGESVATVINHVKEVIDDDRIIVKEQDPEFSTNPSKVSDIESFGFTVLQKTSHEIFPQTVTAPALMIGATDSRHYQGLSDNIFRFSPVQLRNADLARIHGFNERISLQNYESLIRFYHQLIQNSCN